MAQISLPDGSIIPDFPDNPTPQDLKQLQYVGEQMEARMRASTPLGALKEAGKVAGTAVADGVMGLPDLGQSAADWLASKVDSAIRGPEKANATTEGIRKMREQSILARLRKAMRPETELGQRAANVGSAVTGSMLYGGLGGASPGINFTSGLFGGLGSEMLGKMSNPQGPVEHDAPVPKLLGGLTGGLGGGIGHEVSRGLFSSLPYKEKIAKMLLENVTERNVEGAAQRMTAAAQEGIPLLATQAFNKNTNIDGLLELAGKAPLTATRQVLQRQVDASVEKARGVMGAVPGRLSQPSELANRSRDKATKFFDQFKQQMSAVAGEHIPSLDVLNQKSLRQIDKALREYLELHPNQELAAEVVQAARKAMRDPKYQQMLEAKRAAQQQAVGAWEGQPRGLEVVNGKPFPQGGASGAGPGAGAAGSGKPVKYLDNPETLYQALDDALAQTGKNSLLTPDADKLRNMHAAKVREIFTNKLRGPAEEVLDDLGNASIHYPQSQHPILDQQKAAFGEIFARKSEAQKELIGKLANATGDEMGASGNKSLITVFKNAKEYAPRSGAPGQGEIAKLQKQLATAGGDDATLFRDSVKTWLHDAVETARVGPSGQNNPNFMGNLVKQLGNPTGGSDPRWRLTKDILLAHGADAGLSAEEARQAVKGVEKLLTLAARTSQRTGSQTVSAGTILSEATPKALNQIGAINLMTPVRQPALWLKRVHEKEVLRTIDKWLTTPDGLRAMQKLSQAKDYKQIRNVLSTLGTHAAKLNDNAKQFPADGTSGVVFPHTSQED